MFFRFLDSPCKEADSHMSDRKALEEMFDRHGVEDCRWIDPAEIVVAHWVRMKCRFGCDEFGRNACCPPATPPVEECARFFRDYGEAAVFHFAKKVEDPEARHEWTRDVNGRLLELEREVFLAGYPKAFLLFMDSCCLCKKCAGTREKCKKPESARPSPEAMAVDVFQTVAKLGFPIAVLPDYDRAMNRYAFLLVE